MVQSHQRGIGLCARGAVLRGEAEVGERALAVQVEDEPRHLAVANVEQRCSVCPYLPQLQSADLSVSGAVDERQDALAIELAVLLHHRSVLLPRTQPGAPTLRHA